MKMRIKLEVLKLINLEFEMDTEKNKEKKDEKDNKDSSNTANTGGSVKK